MTMQALKWNMEANDIALDLHGAGAAKCSFFLPEMEAVKEMAMRIIRGLIDGLWPMASWLECPALRLSAATRH